jgi:hypothetical protein
MGRHVNADTGSDEVNAGEFADGVQTTDADGTPREPARHVVESAESGLLEPQAEISPDTHIGVDLDAPPSSTPRVAPSPAHPDALVEHGRVGDGHEME